MLPGYTVPGPAVIIDDLGTIIVEPGCVAELTVQGDLRIHIHGGQASSIGLALDAVQLSIFSHRFMSIAEQMGRCRNHSLAIHSYVCRFNQLCNMLQDSATNFCLDQYQRAVGLFLCPLWSGWRPRIECSTHSRPSWSDARSCPIPSKSFTHLKAVKSSRSTASSIHLVAYQRR